MSSLEMAIELNYFPLVNTPNIRSNILFFQTVIESVSQSFTNKDLRFSGTIMQKDLEFILWDEYGYFTINLACVLLPVEKNSILEK